MDNFNWTEFTLKIAVKCDMQTLYDAWSQSGELEKWFLQKAVFHSGTAAVSPTESASPGTTYEWRWFIYEDVENGKVLSANGKTLFEFTFAGNCLVQVALAEENGYTIVALTQKNIPTDEASKKNIRLGCHTGWSFYLINLKSVFEGGLDLRNKDHRFPPMVNN